MIQAFGAVEYDPLDYCCRLLIDSELARYWLASIPRERNAQPPRYVPHITIVRSPPREHVPNKSAWFRHEGERVPFWYDDAIYYGGTYCWIDCYSAHMEAIRVELGMAPTRFENGCFHCTVANFKPLLQQRRRAKPADRTHVATQWLAD